MIRPLENPEAPRPGDYANRVRRTEGDHAAGSRDFGYSIEEVERDKHHRQHHGSPDFGQDTYEGSDADAETGASKAEPSESDSETRKSPPGEDAGLDITV